MNEVEVDADSLITILKCAQAQNISEITGVFSEEGLVFKAMDPSHVSMAFSTLLPAAFTEYVQDQEPFAFSIDFMLDALKPGTRANIDIDGGKMTVRTGRSKRTCRLEGDAPLVKVNMPTLPADVTCLVSTNPLKEILGQSFIKDMDGGDEGPAIKFSSHGGHLTLSGNSNTQSFEEEIECTIEGEGDVRIPIPYLVPISKALPKNMDITIQYATDTPISMIIDNELMEISILIAPLIENGDFDD